MAECYICGSYIPRGEGYRRHVHTGSSARVYVGKLRGGSYGQSYGPRTVCSTCAKISDRSSEGGFLRAIFYIAGWALCIHFALSISNNSYDIEQPARGLLVLFLAIGTPVWIIGAIFGKSRQKQIIEDVVNEEIGHQQRYSQPKTIDNSRSSRKLFDLDSKKVALKSGETVEDWSNRIASYAETAAPEIADDIIDMAESLMNMSKYVKPKAGETIKAYLSRSAKSIEHMKNVDQFFDADLASSGICQDEAFDDWVMRVAFNMDEADIEETQETLKGLAKYVKPAVGESLNDYVKRAQTMIRTI
jgi:hypothetical protein